MKTTPRREFATAALLLAATTGTCADATNDDAAAAAHFLAFETKIDGRCHNLSEGGKLAVLHNTHPNSKIDFRLIRYFVDVPQWGRATGTVEPNAAPVKLGCTLIGGREQRWEIERAHFNTDPTP